jgi:hypothetical protein
VRRYSYTVTEHDAQKPWLVVGQARHLIELDEDMNFFSWAHTQWPRPRFEVQLTPGSSQRACATVAAATELLDKSTIIQMGN